MAAFGSFGALQNQEVRFKQESFFEIQHVQGTCSFASSMASGTMKTERRTSGFARSVPLSSAAMFEPIREQIETAAQKTNQLRRFL
jgi:hypothetical protein